MITAGSESPRQELSAEIKNAPQTIPRKNALADVMIRRFVEMKHSSEFKADSVPCGDKLVRRGAIAGSHLHCIPLDRKVSADR